MVEGTSLLPCQLPTAETCHPSLRNCLAALAAKPLMRESLSTSTAGAGVAVVAVGDGVFDAEVVAGGTPANDETMADDGGEAELEVAAELDVGAGVLGSADEVCGVADGDSEAPGLWAGSPRKCSAKITSPAATAIPTIEASSTGRRLPPCARRCAPPTRGGSGSVMWFRPGYEGSFGAPPLLSWRLGLDAETPR